MNNVTQGTTTLPGHSFTSTANQQEIFVFCLRRTFSDEMGDHVKATACVEVVDVGAFRTCIEAALSPKGDSPMLAVARAVSNSLRVPVRPSDAGSRLHTEPAYPLRPTPARRLDRTTGRVSRRRLERVSSSP